MISDFLAIYAIFHKCNKFLYLDGILVLLLSMVTFFKSIILFLFSLKNSQNFFIQAFPWCKVSLLSMWSNAQIVDTEYPRCICSSIFVVAEFSGLLHFNLFIQLKIPYQHKYCMTFYLLSYNDWILTYYFLIAWQFHKNIYF